MRKYLIPVFSLMLVACASIAPLHIDMTHNFVATKSLKKSTSTTVSSKSLSFSIVDHLEDKNSLGTHDGKIFSTGVIQWVLSGIESLPEFSHQATLLKPREINNPPLVIVVNRASCRASYQNIRCTVLLGASFMNGDTVLKEGKYYGSAVRDQISWAGGEYRFDEGDIVESLNIALSKSLIKLQSDIRLFLRTDKHMV